MFHKIEKDAIGIPQIIDSDFEPLPWWPTSFIEWLEQRLSHDMRVFEWGTGHSTLWLARRVYFVTAMEHHIHWFKAMAEAIDAGDAVSLRYERQDSDRYWVTVVDGAPYDLIIVDGVNRNECIYASNTALSERGVLILDNSDSEALEGQQWLREQGFCEKRFDGEYAWGTNGEIHSTTVFFRDSNCLGL